MGDIDDGHALLLQCMDKFKKNVFFLFGKDGGRFVQNKDLAVLGQGAQDGDDLALYRAHQIDGFFHVDIKRIAPDQLKRGTAQPAAVDGRKDGPRRPFAAQINVFIPREAFHHLGVLIDRRDAAGQGVLGGLDLAGLAVDKDLAGVAGIHAGEDFDHRRFSGAVDAKQRAGLPLPERKAGAAKRLHSRKALVDPLQFELIAHRIPSVGKMRGSGRPLPSLFQNSVRWWAPTQAPDRFRSAPD